MKKKGLAMFALAAVMSLGAAGITAFAAGWAQEGSNWVYYNNNGSKVTNAWRQAQDGTWRYLESSGAMATDKWVDNDDYYVDSSGIMITNKWLQVANSRKASGYDWYYFGTNGKCVKEKWVQIDGQYHYFGDTGVMETGWILDNMYYCDDAGVMVTGWNTRMRIPTLAPLRPQVMASIGTILAPMAKRQFRTRTEPTSNRKRSTEPITV